MSLAERSAPRLLLHCPTSVELLAFLRFCRQAAAVEYHRNDWSVCNTTFAACVCTCQRSEAASRWEWRCARLTLKAAPSTSTN